MGTSQEAIGDSGGGAGGSDIVDAQDVRAGEKGGGRGGKRRGKALLRRAGAEEGFSREPGDEGRAERVEQVKTGEYGEVLIEVLTKAKTRVERDLIGRDAGGEGAVADGGEPGVYGRERVGEIGKAVHGCEIAAVVHENRAAAGAGEEGGHGGILERGDVVNNIGAGVEGSGGG